MRLRRWPASSRRGGVAGRHDRRVAASGVHARAGVRRLVFRLSVPALLAATAVAQEQPADAGPPRAAPVRIEQVTFIPARFTVGDAVELQLVLVGLPAGFDGRPPRPAATAASPLPPVVIDGIALTPLAGGRHLLRLSFRSFQPGVAALPAVDLGGGVVVELPHARTAATLTDGAAQLEPARGPLPLPGTGLRLAAVVVVLLACPGAAVFGARRAVRLLGRLLAAGRRHGPRLRFERDLRALRGRGAPGSAYSAEVARLTRRFLAARLQVPARSKTAAELPALLAGAGLTRHAAVAVTQAIAATERFTFGGAPLGDRDAAALASQARAAVAAAERELDEA